MIVEIDGIKFDSANEDDIISLGHIYGKIAAIRVYGKTFKDFALPSRPDKAQDQIEDAFCDSDYSLSSFIDIALEESNDD